MHAVAEKMWKEELAKETKPSGSKMHRRPEETWVHAEKEVGITGGLSTVPKTCTNKKVSGTYPGDCFLSLIKGSIGLF